LYYYKGAKIHKQGKGFLGNAGPKTFPSASSLLPCSKKGVLFA